MRAERCRRAGRAARPSGQRGGPCGPPGLSPNPPFSVSPARRGPAERRARTSGGWRSAGSPAPLPGSAERRPPREPPSGARPQVTGQCRRAAPLRPRGGPGSAWAPAPGGHEQKVLLSCRSRGASPIDFCPAGLAAGAAAGRCSQGRIRGSLGESSPRLRSSCCQHEMYSSCSFY